MVEDLIKIISNVGFPIGITAYLMFRFEGKLDELTKTITQLVIAINKIENDKD